MKSLFSIFLFFIVGCAFAQDSIVQTSLTVMADGRGPLKGVEVFNHNSGEVYITDESGKFSIELSSYSPTKLTFYASGYESKTILTKDEYLQSVVLSPLAYTAEMVQVDGGSFQGFSKRKMLDVEDFGIYASKKTETISLELITANKSTNNARQVFSGITGLNVWESDGAGLQLSIGSRGLDPNRTANFNTRQNGYDMSADALGYPESYYTPPARAIDRIEMVKGAASLQYGSQFGGLLNFKLRDGNIDNKLEAHSYQTVGSFGYYDGFNSVEGQVGRLQYYAMHQFRRGDGWRENAGFQQNTAIASVGYQLTDKLQLKADLTYMKYLAQQPGGLQDFEFEQDPRSSKRDRNWFQVDWRLAALSADYIASASLKFNTRIFALQAERMALGELGPIHRPDPMRDRTLISGNYDNWGIESRMMKRYKINKSFNHLLLGVRVYNGTTQNMQGRASEGDDPDFKFTSQDEPEVFDYRFPSRNYAVFAENLFYLTEKWTFTPGIRGEYIRTEAEGYYRNEVYSGGELIFSQKFEDEQRNERSFLILGVGSSFRPSALLEFYSNISQNYRSINFTDLVVVNPNIKIDEDLEDERGYNADLGLRGALFPGKVLFDFSLFHLNYDNRIGITEIVEEDEILGSRAISYRTNIGRAQIYGLESFVEGKYSFLESTKNPLSGRWFGNISVMRGRYTQGNSSVDGNLVEYIPELTLKSGLRLEYSHFSIDYLFTYVSEQFSDATNASYVVDATRGIIPAYQVHDLSFAYTHRLFELELQVNNILDRPYFTRRALAYPGPGIIPADGRAFYLTAAFKIDEWFSF